ncbi:hypothetical protein [Vagococcus fluvialis]|uniref:hypothetical protein n=1 Tax=Vagococcus fluvialis TaxID=2738 RepID=UPI002B29CB7C|nr:hypothetical protein QDW48_04685 [Vagococcus fluvialis]
MLFQETDYNLFKDKLQTTIEEIQKTNETNLTFEAWLEESNDEDRHFYNRLCFNYKLYLDNYIIDSSEQRDNYFYDEYFIENDKIDMSYIDFIGTTFKSLLSDAKQIEEQLSKINDYSDFFHSYEISIADDAFEIWTHDSIPILQIKFYTQYSEPIIEHLDDITIDTFKNLKMLSEVEHN